jgi:RNA polymerase sigma-70 factor, ECF subfamily
MNIKFALHKVSGQPSQSDAELFTALKAGQHSALEILYDRYATLVYRLALRILINSQEAEDLTQEIFVNLWRSDAYKPGRGSLSSYLITLTRSRAIDRLRSRTSNQKFLERWSLNMSSELPPLTPFESASLEQRSEYVRNALTELPDRQRRVLEMSYFDGLSQSEIATQLNTPLGTVKSWCRQGLLNLRKNLGSLME